MSDSSTNSSNSLFSIFEKVTNLSKYDLNKLINNISFLNKNLFKERKGLFSSLDKQIFADIDIIELENLIIKFWDQYSNKVERLLKEILLKEEITDDCSSDIVRSFFSMLEYLPLTTRILDHIGVQKIHDVFSTTCNGKVPVFYNVIFSQELLSHRYEKIISCNLYDYFWNDIFPININTFDLYSRITKTHHWFDKLKEGTNVQWTLKLIKQLYYLMYDIYAKKQRYDLLKVKKLISTFFGEVKYCFWELEWLIEMSSVLDICIITKKCNSVAYTAEDVCKRKTELLRLHIFDCCSFLYKGSRDIYNQHVILNWNLHTLLRVQELLCWKEKMNFDVTPDIFKTFYYKWDFNELSSSNVVKYQDIFEDNFEKWDWSKLQHNSNVNISEYGWKRLMSELLISKNYHQIYFTITRICWNEELLTMYASLLIEVGYLQEVLSQSDICLSAPFIRKYEEYFKWHGKSDGRKRSSDQFENYWHSAPTSKNPNLDIPVDIVEKRTGQWEYERPWYILDGWDEHDGGAWYWYSRNNFLTIEHLRLFKDKFDWEVITKENNSIVFNDDFIEEFKDKIRWKYIFERSDVKWSAEFIQRYFNYIDWSIAMNFSNVKKIVVESPMLAALIIVVANFGESRRFLK